MNNVNHRRKALFVGILGASALLLAEGTMAQDDVTNLGIEEMVVTAQKREENVQAVPISISTLSANDIERRGVQSRLPVARRTRQRLDRDARCHQRQSGQPVDRLLDRNLHRRLFPRQAAQRGHGRG